MALAVTLGGCISAFPDEVLRGVDPSLTVAALRAGPPGAHLNARVMLGGEVLSTLPKVGETEMEVLARRLGSSGSPERSDLSEGRFLVRTKGFLDPAVFATGRRVTVVGTVVADEERPIGDLSYRYPVIESQDIRLWPPDVTLAPYPYPYWPYWGVYGVWRPYRLWRPYW